MSVNDINSKNFLLWEVKPVWKFFTPSEITFGTSSVEQKSFTLFGVDRGGLEVVRNWEKINSVEQFNQGFVAKPIDYTITIAVKERTAEYEKLRRLEITGTYFDVQCDILRKESPQGTTITHGSNQHDFGQQEDESTFVHWLDGFEKYLGCLVNRMGRTIEIGTIPIAEFEIVFLRRDILESISGNFNTEVLEEGDGSYPEIDNSWF